MDKRNTYIVKFIIIFLNIIYAVSTLEEGRIPYFIILILLCLFNMQFRIIYFKEKLFLLSVVVDFILIYFLFDGFKGITYLLLYITLIDGVSFSKKYSSGIILTTFIVLSYLIKDFSVEIILMNLFIYSLCIILMLNINKLMDKSSTLEYLYDDVRRYSYELEKTKKQLELYSQRVRHVAQLEERNRISEEIHDTIGHRLTALLIQMQAGVSILDLDSEKSKKLLKASIENLRESIDILRYTVKDMKNIQLENIVEAINNLSKKFTMDTGINIDFMVKGNVINLNSEVQLILYKNAQEGITNGVKHGKAKNIKIHLTFEEDKVRLKISDDGIGCTSIEKGMGLASMEERLKSVKGELRLYNLEDFVIESIIPL
ncbi:sensor histidine kinase [Clostridium malenominatum]|uniref:histidine kinase n=1 Tax=Clostridium malenominatum TaxID=1539 RepID=A0ABN1J232_9CLOT